MWFSSLFNSCKLIVLLTIVITTQIVNVQLTEQHLITTNKNVIVTSYPNVESKFAQENVVSS